MTTLGLLILAIIQVESSGDDLERGDYVNGVATSYGCMQIQQGVIEDVNKRFHTNYTHADAFNRQKSIELFNYYMEIYAIEARVGGVVTAEHMYRIWNKGPNGYLKASSIPHWNKVKKELYEVIKTNVL